MVMDVASTSPLSGILSPGDLIISMNDVRIHNKEEWMEMAALLDEQTLQYTNSSYDVNHFMTDNRRRGYCVPNSFIEESKDIQLVENQYTCPDDLTEFSTLTCFDSSKLVDGSIDDEKRRENIYCLTAKDVFKLNKCGDGWMNSVNNRRSCLCPKDETCLTPVQVPGLTWVEITYTSPYSTECRQLGNNSFPGATSSDLEEMTCGGTFVFIGDVISMVHSVRLTEYQPRWQLPFGAYFPTVLEKTLACTYHVSLTLALLNSLPVYFLDGESILELTLCYFSVLNPRKRRMVLQSCLFGGTLISTVVLLRIFISIFF